MRIRLVLLFAVLCALAGYASDHDLSKNESEGSPTMHLGHLSVSLAVKDINASREFYMKIGFREIGGNIEQNWLILQNGDSTIGLFQGMFENNILTFNPGWDARTNTLEEFSDVRELQRAFKEQGIELTTEADESSSGPASFTLIDPDGNAILVDQHVE